MEHHFFAYINRMKFIQRWGLMRNTMPENDMEHALQAAMIAHAIAVMQRFGPARRSVGVFSLRAESASVKVDLKDGVYENQIDGSEVTVENGRLLCAGSPLILTVPA